MSGTTTAATEPVDAPPAPRRWGVRSDTLRLAGAAAGVYVLSRLLLLLTSWACLVVASLRPGGPTGAGAWPLVPQVHNRALALFGRWDSAWYGSIALHGYGPRDVAATATDGRQAFFPAYPLTLRWVSRLTGVSVSTAGPWLTAAFGLVGVVLLALYTARLFDRAAGIRAAALFAFFPGSFVLVMAYSEGLVVAATAGCLLALHRRAWWVAGLCAAVATATRPTALALVPACLVAAVIAVRVRREWTALVAPVLAPLGALAWFGWLAGGGGSPLRWFQVERGVWREHLSLGVIGRRFIDAAEEPLLHVDAVETAVGSVLLVVAVALILRARLPAADAVYAVLVALSFEVSATIGARPRMLLVVLPAFVAIAGRAHVRVATLLIAVFAALLPVVAVLSWLTPLQTP